MKGHDSHRSVRVGRHLPTSGGYKKTLAAADELGLEAVQVFVSNPQGWAVPPPRPDAEVLAEGSRDIGLYPVMVHAKYLINLASPNPEQRQRSVEALAAELALAGQVGAHLVVVHAGSHGGDGEEKGLDRLADGLDRAREMAASLAGPGGPVAEPVVENSVGAGTLLCASFDGLTYVCRRAGVRACVDSAHAFVAGYDLSAPGGAREAAAELREKLGDALAVLHLNDARNGLGSRRDGHRKVGEGGIGARGMAAFLDGLPGVPAVMETPYATPEEDRREVRFVKRLAGGLRLGRVGG